MGKRNTYRDYNLRETPQSEPIPGTVPNSAGGQSFQVDNWTRLRRFLVLGSEGGTYYIGEKALTKQNAKVIETLIGKGEGTAVVEEIVRISTEGRNAKHQPVIFALAACAGSPDLTTRQAALAALPLVCRTGTHLFLFASYIENFRGWGRSLRNAVASWYTEKDPHDLALQLVKYQSREGWSHRDLLRLSKPRPERMSATDLNLRWAVGKADGPEGLDTLIQAHEEMKSVDARRAAELIELFRVPWEAVPSEMLAKPEIWHALLPNLGMGALVRNLGRLTANGTLIPMNGVEAAIVSKLRNERAVKGSRIHPISVLLAATTYAQGRGVRGSMTWDPNAKVLGALDKTFDMAFHNIEPANKRTLVCLDVSGSMGASRIANTFLSAREASVAMALVTMRTEPQYAVMAFCHDFVPAPIHADMSLNAAVKAVSNMPFGGTDCALPMEWAMKRQVGVDTFVVYTDSETWAGRSHPVQALKRYRQHSGIDAKLVVVGMTSNGFSIADPNDKGMLDVVGFDAAAPALIADFSAGRV